jgi:hypothetical protein
LRIQKRVDLFALRSACDDDHQPEKRHKLARALREKNKIKHQVFISNLPLSCSELFDAMQFSFDDKVGADWKIGQKRGYSAVLERTRNKIGANKPVWANF